MTIPGQQKYDPQTYRSGNRKNPAFIFSSNLPHRAPLLCYVAGVECPIIQASVTYGVWKIPEAQVALFPDPTLQRFGAEDRVNIVLFYLDEYIDPVKPTWRMLFEGEIVGWGYTNTPMGRALQLTAAADISIFTQLFFFYMTTLSTVASGVLSASQTAEQLNQSAAVFPYALFHRGLITNASGQGVPSTSVKVKTGKVTKGKAETTELNFNTNYITRPYDFAYNVITALISTTIPDKQRCVPAVNFFSRWVRRTQFHNKWVALPYLDEVHQAAGKNIGKKLDEQPSGIFPVLRAVKSQKAVECLQNYVAAQNANAAIYTLLKQVLDTVFMEICMLPTPAAVYTQTDGAITGEPQISEFRVRLADPSATVAAQETAKNIEKGTAEAKQQINTYKGVEGLLKTYEANMRKQPQSTMGGGMFEATDEEVRKALADVGITVKSGQLITRDTLEQGLTAAAKGIKDQEARIANAQAFRTATQPIRLTNYFIKPQFFFGLPPVCNVVFPSMTPQIQYQENYITQPTRLYIQDEALASVAPLATQDPTLKQTVLTALARGYPPEADRKFQEQMQTKSWETGKNVLIFPEEFFKGPVTSRFPAPPWLMYYAMENQTGNKDKNPADAKTVTPEGSSLTDKDVYKLYAQYEYFRQRYACRNGAVITAFNPYVVPGFPCMVFDDFQSSLHLVAYLMNCSQNFTSRSVETSLNYSYARTIYEFFQDIYNEIWYPEDIKRKGLACAAAPPEPIPEIRDVIQHFDRAEQFYQALFFRRPTAPGNKPAVFQYRDILAFVRSDGGLDSIVIEGLNEETIKKKKPEAQDALKTLQQLKTDSGMQVRASMNKLTTDEFNKLTKAIDLATGGDVSSVGGYESVINRVDIGAAQSSESALDRAIFLLESQIYVYDHPDSVMKTSVSGQREIAPKPGFEPYFDSYDAAMQYCARPICTLEEYIEFIGGIREGVNDDMAYVTGGAIPSARYYTRIRKLTGGDANTIKTLTLNQKGTGTGDNEPLPDNFPDMRLDWQSAMLDYRARIYSLVKVSR